MPRFRFTSAQRLRRPQDFERIYSLKQKAGDERLLIFMARNDLPGTRVGLSVSRKHGSSVQRHRLRRLLKEAFRLAQHDLPEGWDVILIPRVGVAAHLRDWQASLQRLMEKLARRLG